MLHSVACQGVSRTKASGGMSEYLESDPNGTVVVVNIKRQTLNPSVVEKISYAAVERL